MLCVALCEKMWAPETFLIPCVLVCCRFSHVRLFVTLWTVALQAPLSMEFSRQEYWSGLHTLLRGIFPTQGSNLSPAFPILAGGFFTTSAI